MPKKTMTFEDAMLRLREVTETLEKELSAAKTEE